MQKSVNREYRRVLNTSLPLMAYYFSETAIGLTDLYIVGQLGATELAAVGLGRTIVFGWLMMGFCVLSIVSVSASEARSRRQFRQFHTQFVQGFWLANALALFGIAGIALTPWLLASLGYETGVREAMNDYLVWVAWMLIPGLWFALARNFLTVMNRSRVFLLVSVGAVIVNFLLNHLLVFGRLGFPAMGVSGAGLATVLVNLVSLALLLGYARRTQSAHVRAFFGMIGRFSGTEMWRLVRLGLPAGAMQLLESGFFILISVMVGVYGAAWLAAHNVMLAVIEVNFVIALSVGEALSVRIAWHLGRKDPAMARQVIRFGLLLTTGTTFLVILTLLTIPDRVVALFMNPFVAGYEETVRHAMVLAAITAVLLPFDNYQVLSTWILRGCKDTLIPVVIGTSGYWGVGLGLGFVFSFLLGFGAPGIWWGFALGLFSAAVLLLWRVRGKVRHWPETGEA